MPRKKSSQSNRSAEDDSSSKEIESDSSLELNSRRLTCRKKPQRRYSSKQSENYSQESTEMGKEKQGNSSEKNEKRLPIIKIFRRIDRKAKNMFLVDDKIEDRNKLVTSPVLKSDTSISDGKISPHSSKPTIDKRSLARTFATDVSTITVETNCREYDFGEVNVWDLPGDSNDSYPSTTSINKVVGKSEIDVEKKSCKTDNLYSPKADNAETPATDDVGSQPRYTDYLYFPMTEISKTSTSGVWSQHYDKDDLYSHVTDIAEAPAICDVWNRPLDTDYLYSPVTEIGETSSTSLFGPCVTDVLNRPCDVDVPNSTETDIEQTPSRVDVCSRRLISDFDATDFLGTEIKQTSRKSDALSLLNSDLVISNNNEIPSNKSDHFNFLLHSDIDDLDFLAADYDFLFDKAFASRESFRDILHRSLTDSSFGNKRILLNT